MGIWVRAATLSDLGLTPKEDELTVRELQEWLTKNDKKRSRRIVKVLPTGLQR